MAGGGAAAARAAPGARGGVRIVVAGDRSTGKSSLIVTAAADTFPINVPPLLPPTRLPDDLYPDRVPVTIIDTSSRSLSPSPSLSIHISIYKHISVCLSGSLCSTVFTLAITYLLEQAWGKRTSLCIPRSHNERALARVQSED